MFCISFHSTLGVCVTIVAKFLRSLFIALFFFAASSRIIAKFIYCIAWLVGFVCVSLAKWWMFRWYAFVDTTRATKSGEFVFFIAKKWFIDAQPNLSAFNSHLHNVFITFNTSHFDVIITKAIIRRSFSIEALCIWCASVCVCCFYELLHFHSNLFFSGRLNRRRKIARAIW